MFTRKQKLIVGLSLLFVFASIFSFGLKKVYAFTEAQLNNATYTLTAPDTVTVKIGSQTYEFKDSNTGDTTFNFKPTNQTAGYPCVKNTAGPNDGITIVQDRVDGSKLINITDVGEWIAGGPRGPQCLQLVTINGLIMQNPSGVSYGGGSSPTGPADINECKRGSITSFEFWACPLLEALDGMTTSLNGIVEDLLFFDTTGGNEATGIKSAWNMFRYVSSILIVIVMLTMVISQAISWGPFDAYTVRKILPKLIVAAIGIQLSWVLSIFVIDLFNDIGRGVANLMLLPFGGAGELTLDNIIAESFEGVGTGARLGIFAVMIAGGILAFFNIFLLLAMAVGVVASLFIGFVVLVVRKLLLILLIILAPLALALWILPGTKRYWDLWQNTFIGLLMMFPIIMALIASGRIMAWVVAKGGTFGSVSLGSFLDFLIILVAFFAPFWLIPKTFQWGGKAFGNLAGIFNDKGRGVFDRPRGFLQNRQKQTAWNQGWAARSADRERQAKLDFANSINRGGVRGAIRRASLGPGSATRSRIVEGSGRLLESDMLSQVQGENYQHTNAYLASSGDSGAAITMINSDRAARGEGPMSTAEEATLRTNFQRYDRNGWNGNKVFASAAVQAAGKAGMLDDRAVDAARLIYTNNDTDDQASARWGSIQFNARREARGAGQYRAGTGPQADWRRVGALSSVNPDAMPSAVREGFGAQIIEDFTPSPTGAVTGTALTRSIDYTDGSGAVRSINVVDFGHDSALNNFITELARVDAGDTRLEPRQVAALQQARRDMMTDLASNAHTAFLVPQIQSTIEERARTKQYGT